VVKVDDLVGGQGRTGNFGAYEEPFVGSGRYIKGDVTGKDEVVEVEACDHVDALVDDFTACVNAIKAGGKPDPDWPRRSLCVHTAMSAIFESAQQGCATVPGVRCPGWGGMPGGECPTPSRASRGLSRSSA
jgi:hypothetical protein